MSKHGFMTSHCELLHETRLRTKSTNADITAQASLAPYSLRCLRQFEIFFTGDNNSRLVLRLLILCIIAGWLHIRDQEYLRPPGEGSETRVPRERGMDNYWKETQVILRPDICGNQPLSSLIKLCPVNANCFLYKFKHRAPS